MADYEIISTAPAIVRGNTGGVETGYTVTVLLTEFGEYHEVKTNSLDPKKVKPLIDDLLKQRRALAEMGKSGK